MSSSLQSYSQNPLFYTCLDTPIEVSFLLSIFDNIVGPKCVHFWSSHPDKFKNTQLLKYISVNTLNGELYTQDKLINSTFKYKIYMINEINYAILSIFFDANTMDTTAFSSNVAKSRVNNGLQQLNCFSIIFSLDKKQYLLDHTQFIMSFFEQSILMYKVFAEISERKDKVTKALSNLTLSINRFCFELNTLNNRGLKCINIKDTYLLERETTIDRDFIVCALTSHLITNMNTFVVGKSSSLVNKMISTLACFMPSDKHMHSCYSFENSSELSSYFNLQGYVTENPNDFKSFLNAQHLLHKQTPSTIIDLSTNSVYRTPILDDFIFVRESFSENKVQMYYNGLSKEELLKEWSLDYLIQNVSKSKSLMILDLFKHLDSLDTEYGLREGYLKLFIKDLYLQAFTLVEYLNTELLKIPHNKQIQSIPIKRLLKELDYKREEDLFIILSFANYLKGNFDELSHIIKS